MMVIANWFLQLLSAPLLNTLLSGWKATLDARNATDRIAADLVIESIKADIEANKSAQAIIIAEQGRWYTAIVRPLLATPIIIFMWKVIVWDKVLGWGTTEALSGDVASWAGWIVTAYVGGRSLEKIAGTVATRFTK
jgi:hypothetical protein